MGGWVGGWVGGRVGGRVALITMRTNSQVSLVGAVRFKSVEFKRQFPAPQRSLPGSSGNFERHSGAEQPTAACRASQQTRAGLSGHFERPSGTERAREAIAGAPAELVRQSSPTSRAKQPNKFGKALQPVWPNAWMCDVTQMIHSMTCIVARRSRTPKRLLALSEARCRHHFLP